MGLLEQLEMEAEQQRRAEARLAAEHQQRKRDWAEALLPGMRSLDLHMQRLVAELQRLRPVARRVASLPGYGDVVAYSAHDYRLHSRLDDGAYELSLQFSADIASDECPQVTVHGVANVTAVAAALWQQRLFGVLHASRNERGEATMAVFRARGRIVSRLRVVADQASGNVRLQLTNIEGFGQSIHVWSAADLGPQRFGWFDDAICGHLPPAMVESALPSTAARVGERRRGQRRTGVRLGADPAAGSGRRQEDRIAVARLRPYLDSGARSEPLG